MSEFEINVDACRSRQRRLIDVMQERDIDLVLVTQVEHVQWLAGPRFSWVFQPAAALTADGHLTLVAPNEAPAAAAADTVVTYEAQWHSTLRNDQRQASSAALLDALQATKPARVGVEFSSCSSHLLSAYGCDVVDVEPDLFQLRRRKDSDEVALIRKAIAGTERMYERAREIIEPGITELEVFNQLQAAAVLEFGEMLTGTGNDYRCGEKGGPPRADRPAKAGELYILDLGPAFRGYFADNCRAIAVTEPTDVQQEAWTYVTRVLDHVQQTVRPGKKACELFK